MIPNKKKTKKQKTLYHNFFFIFDLGAECLVSYVLSSERKTELFGALANSFTVDFIDKIQNHFQLPKIKMCKNKETKQYNSNWASRLVHESVESSMVNETQDQKFFSRQRAPECKQKPLPL